MAPSQPANASLELSETAPVNWTGSHPRHSRTSGQRGAFGSKKPKRIKPPRRRN